MKVDSRSGGEVAPTTGRQANKRRKNRNSRRSSNSETKMTKQARRQRKKSCSSLETGMTDHSQGSVKRHDGKQKTVSTEEQKSAIRPTPSDENSSCQTQGLSSGNRIRDWFSGLSWEDRSSVMSIQDGAFLATLVDLATPLSEPHAATGLASSSRGRDGE